MQMKFIFLLLACATPTSAHAQNALNEIFDLSPSASSTAPLFDIIIPGEVMYRSQDNSIGLGDGGHGWVVARGDTLSVEDLQSAEFTSTTNDPIVTTATLGFDNIENWAPILPGEAAGSRFSTSSYGPLLSSGESLKTPTGGAGIVSFFTIGFSFPASPTYTGSTFEFEGSVTIRGQTVNYSTDVTIVRSDSSGGTIRTNPQRLSSVAVPEPGSFALVAIGGLVLALTRQSRRHRYMAC